MMRHWIDQGSLRPVPGAEILGHLRPAEQYRVDTIARESSDGAELQRYLISGMRRNGIDVAISLRLCLRDKSDPRIAFTIPGGAGQVDDGLLTWIARYVGGNHAVVDWVGRGQSGSHAGLSGSPDPLFMEGDTFRDCFQFYNLSAIWSALNWMFHIGLRPTDLIGGSWGGVYCLLMSALDERVERVFSSFGCGGFSLPGIEKRSYWDAAIEHIGNQKFMAWCAAFDPLVRIGDVNAEVYFETATNDKFFSLDMAMETWRRLNRRNFLSLAHNQDHRMGENGLQPYRLQRLEREHPVIAQGKAVTGKNLTWEVKSDNVVCWPLSPDEAASSRLIVSEQWPDRGNMSREWKVLEPIRGVPDAGLFKLAPTRSDASILYYLDQEIASAAGPFKAATPIVGGRPSDRGLEELRVGAVQHCLIDARTDDLASAPIGDKLSPKVVAGEGAWSVAFTGRKWLRTMRFGIRPWLLPADWSCIEVELAAAVDDSSARLHLVLSKAYNRLDERALSQRFSDATAIREGESWKYRFAREAFSGVSVLDGRFGGRAVPDSTDVAGEFDAIGIMDSDGSGPTTISVVSMRLQ